MQGEATIPSRRERLLHSTVVATVAGIGRRLFRRIALIRTVERCPLN
jgi:hypothetical protein